MLHNYLELWKGTSAHDQTGGRHHGADSAYTPIRAIFPHPHPSKDRFYLFSQPLCYSEGPIIPGLFVSTMEYEVPGSPLRQRVARIDGKDPEKGGKSSHAGTARAVHCPDNGSSGK